MFVAFMPQILSAEWLPLKQNSKTASAPQVKILSDDATSTVIQVEIQGIMMKELLTDGENFQKFDLLTDIWTIAPGSPEVPHIAEILAIPNQVGVSVEVIEIGKIETFKNIHVQPARESWWEGDAEPSYSKDSKSYGKDVFYPEVMAKMDDPVVFRDFRISRLSVYPVRYNPVREELQVATSITVKVNYGKGEVINPNDSPLRPIAPSFGKIYRSSILNYKQVLNRIYGGREEGEDLMLCIMPDEFVESFETYAEWNRRTGTNIHVTKFSDIGANAYNPDIIKDHITDAYYNWETCPTYVLVVGDDGVFPAKTITYPDYSFAYDNYFVNIAGGDEVPEMMIGRFTNQGDYRMRVMINKYQLYEEHPYIEETDWFTSGICCSNNAYESQVETKRFARDCMVEDGGFTHVDTLMSDGWGWNCSMDVDDIINAIEDGRSYLNYRGEGWYYGWYANCYDFYEEHVSDLQNGQKFTFVTSIGCGVAMWEASGGNCFGEQWIQVGSISEPRGGIGFIGPTSNTHTTYNNRIDKGIYVGMFREGMDTPGQAITRGKLYMYNVFGNDYWVWYHYNVFHVLGDPSIHVWKEVPREVNVEHETLIPVGFNELEFQVNFADNGAPADSVQVCLYGPDVFATTICDSLGKATITIATAIEDTISVVVRGGDVYPYQSYMVVTQPDELVEPEGEPEMVDLDGNQDGLLNPNEHAEITFTLKNWGALVVNNIQATLSSTNPDVQVITTAPVNFGNISPGEMATGNPFEFYVAETCPIGDVITLDLHVTSTLSSWDYDYEIEVKGCDLSYEMYMVGDELSTMNNYRMDPGEDVRLFMSVSNPGVDIAPNVGGTISSSDPYITITDETATFGTLQIEGMAINEDDYFEVSIASNCPTGYMADFELELFTQNGNYPFQKTIAVQLPVALPVPTDYTGPDEYGYYAFSSTDAFYDQTPEFAWFEVHNLGDELNMYGETDYTETVDLPFTFKYYGMEYNKLRISTDGWIAFGNGVQTAPVNYSLPHDDNVNNMVAIFWDDLYDTQFEDGNIYYYHDAANHRFVVEWDSITHNNAGPEPIREEFQVFLLDPDHYQTNTGDGEIILQYRDVKDASSNTIGIENNTEDIGLQYVFDEEYDQTAAAINGGVAIKFTTEAPFVSIIVSVEEGEVQLNNTDGLLQNNPNPFSSQTTIAYFVSKSCDVTLNIFDISGKLVKTIDEGNVNSGNHQVTWNGTDNHGKMLESGIYMVRLQTSEFTDSMKMFMLK
jgi:hypothetical protein